ncbi:hypothetical protein FJZ18_00255 [Candidatus Pacearchaeota archaeon]|nr:hypothetical protein [Candidatus Pacearchaeota archaeon]
MNKILLKDILFNESKVKKIADEIHNVYSSFKREEFVHEVFTKFPELELKARISWIAVSLKKYLPEDYPRTVGILIKSLPQTNNPDVKELD